MNFKEGQLFAVTQGDYRGSNIIIVDIIENNMNILDLPDMKNMVISKYEMKLGIEHNILELLETVPQDILNTCKEQYEKNTNSR